jgi:hypothetical protein
MRYPVIKTDSYLLIVNDDKIRMGDYYVDDYFFLRKCVVDDSEYWSNRKEYKKLIAHRPLNNAPHIDGLDVLPPNWRDSGDKDDVEQLAEEHAEHQFKGISDRTSMFECKNDFKSGYQESREKYKFTEEDMLQAAKYGYEFRDTTSFPEHNFEDSCINNTKQWLKSRQQPKYPIAFESVDIDVHQDTGHHLKKVGTEPNKITNAEGRIEWVGEWVYE